MDVLTAKCSKELAQIIGPNQGKAGLVNGQAALIGLKGPIDIFKGVVDYEVMADHQNAQIAQGKVTSKCQAVLNSLRWTDYRVNPGEA